MKEVIIIVKKISILLSVVFISLFTLISCNSEPLNNILIIGYTINGADYSSSKNSPNEIKTKLTSSESEVWFGTIAENQYQVIASKKFNVYVNINNNDKIEAVLIKADGNIKINDHSFNGNESIKINVNSDEGLFVLNVELEKNSKFEILNLYSKEEYAVTGAKKLNLIVEDDLIEFESDNLFKAKGDSGIEYITFMQNKELNKNNDYYEYDNSQNLELAYYYIINDYLKLKCKRIYDFNENLINDYFRFK